MSLIKNEKTKQIARIAFVAFALICLMVLATGCADSEGESSSNENGSVSEQVEEQGMAATQSADKNRVIRMTDNYSYVIPEGYTETEEDVGELASEARSFVSDDGTRKIRSWVYDDGVLTFPDDIEMVSEQAGMDLVFSGFFDTALAQLDGRKSEDGQYIYRTLLVWPDGAKNLCWIEILSAEERSKYLIKALRESVIYSNADEECGPYGFAGEEIIIPDKEEGYHSHEEELINEKMRREWEKNDSPIM